LRFQVAAVKVFCEITHPRRACMAVSPPALMPVCWADRRYGLAARCMRE
jgi:hypothetical protein